MLPPELHLLDALPRTATGKLDRLRLAGADRPRPDRARRLDPARGESEAAVAGCFARVLGLAEVGRGEGFFELGGDSLAAARLLLELGDRHGCELPLRDLLADPTVAGIASRIARLRTGRSPAAALPPVLVPLRDTGSRRPLFLVHGMLGQAFVSPAFVEALGDEQPLYGFQARGADGRGHAHRDIPRMAREYVAAMRAV